ncbi:hypothetical protein ACJX0J_022136 [Zea mays]
MDFEDTFTTERAITYVSPEHATFYDWNIGQPLRASWIEMVQENPAHDVILAVPGNQNSGAQGHNLLNTDVQSKWFLLGKAFLHLVSLTAFKVLFNCFLSLISISTAKHGFRRYLSAYHTHYSWTEGPLDSLELLLQALILEQRG